MRVRCPLAIALRLCMTGWPSPMRKRLQVLEAVDLVDMLGTQFRIANT